MENAIDEFISNYEGHEFIYLDEGFYSLPKVFAEVQNQYLPVIMGDPDITLVVEYIPATQQ